MKTIHFTIGPVQEFISQSRRTRDLLASSFLLSYLSGHAMVRVIQQGGKIVFPYVQGTDKELLDPLLQAIDQSLEENTKVKGPWIGSVPNRFKAEVKDDFDPKQCVIAVEEAWQRISDAVWREIEAVQNFGNETKNIWNRQVKKFWEIAWVVGEADNLLDHRKNWRSFVPSEESGDKCTLIPHLQELSGHFRSDQQKTYWKQVREHLDTYDLGEHERLSAIGMIKRLFTRVTKQAIGWEFPKEAQNFPSTTYLAALPWVCQAMRDNQIQAIDFADTVNSCGVKRVDNGAHLFPVIKQVTGEKPNLNPFISMQGDCFYRSGLISTMDKLSVDVNRQEVIEKYNQLTKEIGEPSTYYALLIMDGDHLGKLLKYGGEDSGKIISQALAKFTKGLKEVIQEHNGATVYAGGDDVLTMLPMQEALPVAVKLREKYKKAFSSYPSLREHATISAGIVFAHYHTPLQNTIQSAHRLLDEEAKKKCGRNSLAIGVLKRSGADLIWTAPWEVVYQDPIEKTGLEQLADQLKSEDKTFTNAFLYKLREVYEDAPPFSDDFKKHQEILTSLVAADYRRLKPSLSIEEAERIVSQLLYYCFDSKRDNQNRVITDGKFSSTAALLIRFLAQKGELRT